MVEFLKGLFLGRKAVSAAKSPNFIYVVVTPTGNNVTFVDPVEAHIYALRRGASAPRTVRVASF